MTQSIAPSGRNNSPAFVVFAAFAVLYALTAAPGLLWQDSAIFQYRVWYGDCRGELGLALSHPLYIGLAKLFSYLPFGNHAFRVNLFSALCGAATLAVMADLIHAWTRSRFAALVSTVLLGVSHTFWKHAAIAEVLTLYSLALVIELRLILCFLQRGRSGWLLAAAFVNGLSASNHLLATLHMPAYVGLLVWSIRTRRVRVGFVGSVMVVYLIGLSPYLVLIGRELVGGRALGETIRSALFGEGFAEGVLNTSFSLTRQVAKACQYFVLNFPTPLLLLAPWGWAAARRDPQMRQLANLIACIFPVSFIFAFRYPVADQYVFYFPCYVLWALLTAPAIAGIRSSRTNWRAAVVVMALIPVAVYEVAPRLLKHWNVAVPFRRDVPFRDAYAYFLRPRTNGDNSAERMARAALDQVGPDGLLLSDFTMKSALVYARDVLGVQRGVTLNLPCDLAPQPPMIQTTPETVEPFVSRGAAYSVTRSPEYLHDFIVRDYDFEPAGVVFRLRHKSP